MNIPVSNDTATLVLPELKEDFLRVNNIWESVDHTLPDTRQVTQVENIMELGRGRQHLNL